MKTFYTINFSESNPKKELLRELKAALLGKNIDYKNIKSEDVLVDIGDGVVHSPKIIVNNSCVDIEDAYFWFRSKGNSRRMISVIASLLDTLGVAFSDPFKKYASKIHSKPMQAIRLSGANIRIPRTLISTVLGLTANEQYIKDNMIFPVVFKADGSQGRNVWKVNSVEDIKHRLSQVSEKRTEIFVIQEVVTGADYDIRALFFKDKFIGAIRRQGSGFLNNYSQGGNVEKYTLTSEEMAICQEAKAVSLLDYIGVDFMVDSKGRPVIIELQNGPGSSAMRITHPGLNIGESIVDSLT